MIKIDFDKMIKEFIWFGYAWLPSNDNTPDDQLTPGWVRTPVTKYKFIPIRKFSYGNWLGPFA